MTAIVTRKSEVAGVPDLQVKIANTPFGVFLSLVKAGSKGITCRDWQGYDLRHHLRVLRNAGIGIDRTWEKHEGGQHGRWRLQDGHTHIIIDDPQKRKPASSERAFNSTPDGENGGVSNE